MVDSSFICERISELRNVKGVSARDMSLSLGQSAGYINNIENKNNLPSMQLFLYICEYLDISPKDFFDEDNKSPKTLDKTVEAVKRLNRDQQKLIIDLAKEMK